MTKISHNLFWAALILLIIAALVLGLRPQPILVEVSQVQQAPMQVTIDEEGKSRVKDRYIISAPVAGFVRRIELDVGDTLKQGSLVTELEPLRSDVLDPRRRAEAEARVAAARSALLSAEEQAVAAKADADYAANEFGRKQQLADNKLISDDELNQAHTADQRAKAVLRSASFAVDVARYELDAASTLLKYSAADEATGVLKERVAIRTPTAGSVLQIHKQSEGVVAAGTPLLELGDPTALEIAVDVLSYDAVRIRAGMPVLISRWGGKPLQGQVRLVEPVGFTQVSALGVEEQRVWVIVDITSPVEQWQNLGDGYRVEASFILWQQDNVRQVANAALFNNGEGMAVYVAEDGEAHLRPVQTGTRNGLNSQVISGLNAGEQVLLYPDNAIRDGSRIQIRE